MKKMKKDKAVIKKDNPLSIMLDSQKVEEFKALVKKSMPEFVEVIETKEDMVNSMFKSSQEMWLAIADTLVRYHGWKEDEFKKFTKEMGDILTGLKEFEDSGLSMLSPNTVDVVGDKIQDKGISGLLAEIAQIRYKKERINRARLESPNMLTKGYIENTFVKPKK